MLRAVNASLNYQDHGRDVFACRDISIDVQANEFVGILGPSGSGKSSLLYLLSGLKTPTGGDILYQGKSIPAMSDEDRSRLRIEEFGFVFQQPFLLGYLTALENISIIPRVGTPNEANELLEQLGMGAKAHRFPHELSGGERQRVCVARALYGRPKIIFADEPTAALDHKNGVSTVNLLNRLRGEGSLVMVTHDPTMLDGADRVIRLADGEMTAPILGGHESAEPTRDI
jgi:putative ABC transport system ATP-binding protein